MKKNIRILIVEDEAILGALLKANLELAGYDICGIAPTGTEAAHAAINQLPDVVLMDIRLQGNMDGVSAAEQILSARAVPIIFMTGYADEETETRMQALNPAATLSKPITPNELIPVLTTLFDG